MIMMMLKSSAARQVTEGHSDEPSRHEAEDGVLFKNPSQDEDNLIPFTVEDRRTFLVRPYAAH